MRPFGRISFHSSCGAITEADRVYQSQQAPVERGRVSPHGDCRAPQTDRRRRWNHDLERRRNAQGRSERIARNGAVRRRQNPNADSAQRRRSHEHYLERATLFMSLCRVKPGIHWSASEKSAATMSGCAAGLSRTGSRGSSPSSKRRRTRRSYFPVEMGHDSATRRDCYRGCACEGKVMVHIIQVLCPDRHCMRIGRTTHAGIDRINHARIC